jgi:3-oxoacyl-[acyl-carrier protein] reductase
VNCIAPGFVRSNTNTEKQWAAMGEQGQQALLFFASDKAGWVSGQTMAIDGGK